MKTPLPPAAAWIVTSGLALFPAAAPAEAQEHAHTSPSETFARLYPVRAKTFVKASSDPDERPQAPARGNDDGFSGANEVESFRTSVGGADVAVLADIEGRPGFMGCFFRNFWSDPFGLPLQAQEMNRTQLIVDGTVRWDMPLPDFFRSPVDPRGQVAPFKGFFTGNRSGAHLTHTPIVWQDSFRLQVFENPFGNAARFHKVCGTLGPPEGVLDVPDLKGWEVVAAANGGWPHSSPRWPHKQTMTITADGGVREIRLGGRSTILELGCKVLAPSDWDGLHARFTWDSMERPSVDVPLRLLGGLMRPPFSRAFTSVLISNNGADKFQSYFPMPFRESARLEFWNMGSTDVQLEVTWAVSHALQPDPWGYFSAFYQRAVTETGKSFRGPKLDGVRGMLRGILLETSADTTGRIQGRVDLMHLEGDLCVRINQNRGDEHNFAATETSIGKWGWYASPADRFFSSDCSFQTGIQLISHGGGVYETDRLQGSTFIFDPIHFVSGIDIVLEHGVQNLSNADYGLMTLFYLQPGAARVLVADLDVGDPVSEAAMQARFGRTRRYVLQSQFFRDTFFGTPPLSDDVRDLIDPYRFTVSLPDSAQELYGFCLGFRLDRERTGKGGACQADVYVDGVRAGLLHSYSSNQLFRWKEGGELEVELPRALTDGKASFDVEIRPRLQSEPVRIADVKVWGYVRS